MIEKQIDSRMQLDCRCRHAGKRMCPEIFYYFAKIEFDYGRDQCCSQEQEPC